MGSGAVRMLNTESLSQLAVWDEAAHPVFASSAGKRTQGKEVHA